MEFQILRGMPFHSTPDETPEDPRLPHYIDSRIGNSHAADQIPLNDMSRR
jgi:hypothetical protein